MGRRGAWVGLAGRVHRVGWQGGCTGLAGREGAQGWLAGRVYSCVADGGVGRWALVRELGVGGH